MEMQVSQNNQNKFAKEQNQRTYISRLINQGIILKVDIQVKEGEYESLEINPHIYYQLIFDKASKGSWLGKDNLYNKWARTSRFPYSPSQTIPQTKKLQHCLRSYTKFN